MFVCPNCGTAINAGEFTELVVYEVSLKEENGLRIRDAIKEAVSGVYIGAPSFMCGTCHHEFDVFKEVKPKEVK